MKIQAMALVIGIFMAVPCASAVADPRSQWPNPSMSNADLRKSCSSEASRVHRLARGFRTDRTYMAKLRRDYRRDCVARVKRQRKAAPVLGFSGPAGAAGAWS